MTGPFTAYAEAEVINKHALEATGGKTYAELDREDPARQTAMQASFLRASLFTSVVAFGVAAMATVLGIVMRPHRLGAALHRRSGGDPGVLRGGHPRAPLTKPARGRVVPRVVTGTRPRPRSHAGVRGSARLPTRPGGLSAARLVRLTGVPRRSPLRGEPPAPTVPNTGRRARRGPEGSRSWHVVVGDRVLADPGRPVPSDVGAGRDERCHRAPAAPSPSPSWWCSPRSWPCSTWSWGTAPSRGRTTSARSPG